MNYTNEILERLQKGESVEDIAATLTKSLNDANEQHKAIEAAKKAEAEAKAKAEQDNLYNQKVEVVAGLLANCADLCALYELDEELVNAIEEIEPEEIVETFEQMIPFLNKYVALSQELEELKKKSQKSDAVNLKAATRAVDPIEDFLNNFVR
jgi:hypothetical protein